jgi:hypothetical protein
MAKTVRDRRRELVERRIKQVASLLDGDKLDGGGFIDAIAAETMLEQEQLLWDQLELLEPKRSKVIGIGRNVATCECCDDDEGA